jgi:putative FmdB family regulatory protein
VPIYEWKCEACGREVEILHKRPVKKDWRACDKCKGIMKRKISAPSEPVVHGFSEKNGYSNIKDTGKNGKKPSTK